MAVDRQDRAELQRLFREFAKSRDSALRDQLVSAHMGLAEHLARRLANRGEPVDDLIQVASLALLKAVERFDPERGLEFSTFATPTIVGELKRHFRDKGWAVRVPRRIQELHLRMGTVIGELTQREGRSPTVGEIAQATSASEEDVLEAIDAGHAYRLASLDAPGATGDENPLASRLGQEDPRLNESEQRATLLPLLEHLAERERLIVHLRFFEGKTQSEIAGALGLSQMHVSRLLARSLAELRAVAQHED